MDGQSAKTKAKEAPELPEGFGAGVTEEQAQELQRLLEEIEMYGNECLPELCHSWLDIFGFNKFIQRKENQF